MQLLYLYLVHQYTLSAPKVAQWEICASPEISSKDLRASSMPGVASSPDSKGQHLDVGDWPGHPLGHLFPGTDLMDHTAGYQSWLETRDVFLGQRVSRWKMQTWRLRRGCKPRCEVQINHPHLWSRCIHDTDFVFFGLIWVIVK